MTHLELVGCFTIIILLIIFVWVRLEKTMIDFHYSNPQRNNRNDPLKDSRASSSNTYPVTMGINGSIIGTFTITDQPSFMILARDGAQLHITGFQHADGHISVIDIAFVLRPRPHGFYSKDLAEKMKEQMKGEENDIN